MSITASTIAAAPMITPKKVGLPGAIPCEPELSVSLEIPTDVVCDVAYVVVVDGGGVAVLATCAVVEALLPVLVTICIVLPAAVKDVRSWNVDLMPEVVCVVVEEI